MIPTLFQIHDLSFYNNYCIYTHTYRHSWTVLMVGRVLFMPQQNLSSSKSCLLFLLLFSRQGLIMQTHIPRTGLKFPILLSPPVGEPRWGGLHHHSRLPVGKTVYTHLEQNRSILRILELPGMHQGSSFLQGDGQVGSTMDPVCRLHFWAFIILFAWIPSWRQYLGATIPHMQSGPSLTML